MVTYINKQETLSMCSVREKLLTEKLKIMNQTTLTEMLMKAGQGNATYVITRVNDQHWPFILTPAQSSLCNTSTVKTVWCEVTHFSNAAECGSQQENSTVYASQGECKNF